MNTPAGDQPGAVQKYVLAQADAERDHAIGLLPLDPLDSTLALDLTRLGSETAAKLAYAGTSVLAHGDYFVSQALAAVNYVLAAGGAYLGLSNGWY